MSGEGYRGPAQHPAKQPWWKRVLHWWMGRR